jgi:uncharacterized membrane protein
MSTNDVRRTTKLTFGIFASMDKTGITVTHFVNAFAALLLLAVLVSCTSRPEYRAPVTRGDEIIIDASQLKNGEPSFFTFSSGSQRTDFFVIRNGGAVESYIDACRKCYQHKQGFRADGHYLTCRFCKERYPIDALKTGSGSCHPLPLKGELRSRYYVIKISEVKKASRYF